MEPKQRLFIYDRKEMGVLILLGITVALFAFTLGVHLGKRVGHKATVAAHSTETTAVATLPDKAPERHELPDVNGDEAPSKSDEALRQALHDEVSKTGIRLEEPKPVELPSKTKSPQGGATTLGKEDSAPAAEPAHSAHEGETIAEHETPPALDQPIAPETHAANEHAPPAAAKHPKANPRLSKTPHRPLKASEELQALRRPAPEGKYTLQVGSYPSINEAKNHVESLELLGMKPVMRSAAIKDRGRWYRIYVGGFESKEDAEKTGSTYRERKLIKSFIVSKRVD